MKKFLFLIMSITLILVLSAPVVAEEPGIHGETSFKYELATDNPGQSWTIDLHYNFIDWFAVGTTETTFTNGYSTYFSSVPAFIPNGQLYEFYIQFNPWDNVSIKLCQWCNHPVYSGTLDRSMIPQGFYIEGKYKF